MISLYGEWDPDESVARDNGAILRWGRRGLEQDYHGGF
jgi:hypothetical protein